MRALVEDLFHAVADLPGDARARYFAERHIDETTQAEVQALLEYDSEVSLPLRSAISAIADRALAGVDPNDILCGPYRLKELLGRGGMGTVHLAERVDGEITQQVAVKLLRPDAEHALFQQRFLVERQILATLSHPNIGRLLDAGHREDGQPYLVMEYVEGQLIDEYAAGLTIPQKIVLFQKVCGAVGYLHGNLVVHRDLKPSNILVTAEGEPKILDFGIAKTLNVAPASTAATMRILTPDYASPEQVAGGPMTTATDIYSLGAVLYKLLTDVSPHQFDGDTAESITATVCGGEITPPSRRVPALKGDLEIILMKALRKEPRERYATVEQLSEDLQSYLESGPIRARRDEIWYRARKFLRRHWVVALATALVVLSLATGLYVANRERVIAERRFSELRQLSKRMIDLDGAIRILPGSLQARQRLVQASLEYLEGLSHDAARDLELAQETADGYWRMARIQGVTAEFNLGDHTKAEDSLRKADRLIELVLASHPRDRNALIRSAVIAHDRMILADTDGRRADAIAQAHKAAERLETFLSVKDPGKPVHLDGFLRPGDALQAERMGTVLLSSDIALASVNMHLYADGARYARRAAEISRSIPKAADITAGTLSVLANALRYQGDLEGALSTIREAREISSHATYSDGTARFFNLYALMHREALILGEADAINLNRPTEAIEVLEKTLELTEGAAARDAHDSASRGRLGTTARDLGDLLRERDPKRALAVFDLGIGRVTEAGDSRNSRRELASLLAGSSYPLRRLGRRPEAKERIDRAFEILKDTKDYPSGKVQIGSQAYRAVSALADYESDAGNLPGAIRDYEQLLSEIMAAKPEPVEDLRDAPGLSRIYDALAALYRRTGDSARAEAMRSQKMAIWLAWQRKLPGNAFVRRQLAGIQ